MTIKKLAKKQTDDKNMPSTTTTKKPPLGPNEGSLSLGPNKKPSKIFLCCKIILRGEGGAECTRSSKCRTSLALSSAVSLRNCSVATQRSVYSTLSCSTISSTVRKHFPCEFFVFFWKNKTAKTKNGNAKKKKRYERKQEKLFGERRS